MACNGSIPKRALCMQRKIHDQYGILLDDTDQQQNSESCDQAEFGARGHQGQQGAESGRRQG